MIRIADQVVADWGIFVWEQDGELLEQVKVYLYSGLLLIMDLEDFFSISDDGTW